MSDALTYINASREAALEAIETLRPHFFTKWDVIFTKPNFEQYFSEYDLSVGAIPTLPTYNPTATYNPLEYDPHKSHVWDVAEMDQIEQEILDVFSNGGYGISQELQDSIFNADRERKLLALQDSLDKANADFSAQGFRIPSNILTGARNEIILKYQYDMENINREITKLMEEHARTNWQFAVQQGIAAESFHAAFVSRYDEMFIRMTEAAVNKYKLLVEAELQAFKAKVEAITATISVNKVKIEAGASAINAQVQRAKLELDAEIAKTSAAIEAMSKNAASEVSRYNNYAALAQSIAQTAAASESNINLTTFRP